MAAPGASNLNCLLLLMFPSPLGEGSGWGLAADALASPPSVGLFRLRERRQRSARAFHRFPGIITASEPFRNVPNANAIGTESITLDVGPRDRHGDGRSAPGSHCVRRDGRLRVDRK